MVENINSAVFSEDGRRIIAANNDHIDNIVVFDAQTTDVDRRLRLNRLSSIKLTFPDLHEDIMVDKYRLFTIERLQDGNFIAFGAYYETQSDFDDSIGKTMMFFFGDQVNEGTSLDDLK